MRCINRVNIRRVDIIGAKFHIS